MKGNTMVLPMTWAVFEDYIIFDPQGPPVVRYIYADMAKASQQGMDRLRASKVQQGSPLKGTEGAFQRGLDRLRASKVQPKVDTPSTESILRAILEVEDAPTSEWKEVVQELCQALTKSYGRAGHLRKTLETVIDVTVSSIPCNPSGGGLNQSRTQRRILDFLREAGLEDEVGKALRERLKESPVPDHLREFQIRGIYNGTERIGGIGWFRGTEIAQVTKLALSESTTIERSSSTWRVTRIK